MTVEFVAKLAERQVELARAAAHDVIGLGERTEDGTQRLRRPLATPTDVGFPSTLEQVRARDAIDHELEDPTRVVARPASTTIGDIRPADTIRRASSATRANQAIESETRSASSGSSDSQTAVPRGSSCTDAAWRAGRCGTSMLIRATAPYDTGESCQPLRVPSLATVRNPE
jgi:hypothetical protein